MENLFFFVLRSSCLACTRPCNPDRIPTETTWGLGGGGGGLGRMMSPWWTRNRGEYRKEPGQDKAPVGLLCNWLPPDTVLLPAPSDIILSWIHQDINLPVRLTVRIQPLPKSQLPTKSWMQSLWRFLHVPTITLPVWLPLGHESYTPY